MFLAKTLLFSLISFGIHGNLQFATPQVAVNDAQNYKWGKIAVLSTQKKYPNFSVVDYLPIGRDVISPTEAKEKFKLWLRNDKKNLGYLLMFPLTPLITGLIRSPIAIHRDESINSVFLYHIYTGRLISYIVRP